MEEWTLEDLHSAVEAQLEELRSLLYRFERSGTIDIYTMEVIEDLSFKLEGVLYCRSNCHYCVDPLRDAYDFACDIERVANIVHTRDLAAIGRDVAKLIFDYAWETGSMWESDK